MLQIKPFFAACYYFQNPKLSSVLELHEMCHEKNIVIGDRLEMHEPLHGKPN